MMTAWCMVLICGLCMICDLDSSSLSSSSSNHSWGSGDHGRGPHLSREQVDRLKEVRKVLVELPLVSEASSITNGVDDLVDAHCPS